MSGTRVMMALGVGLYQLEVARTSQAGSTQRTNASDACVCVCDVCVCVWTQLGLEVARTSSMRPAAQRNCV
jgi:hypothetical protein